MKLFTMQYSPASRHLLPLKSIYSPQYPVLKHLNSNSSISVRYKVSQPYKTGKIMILQILIFKPGMVGRIILRFILGTQKEEWIHLAEDCDQWRAFVNMAMNLSVPYTALNFFTTERLSASQQVTASNELNTRFSKQIFLVYIQSPALSIPMDSTIFTFISSAVPGRQLLHLVHS